MNFFLKGNNRSTFGRPLANKKGQVALFIALIFQILFLFFAMVINVGLLIHHKINLQNSVDLAAYYGAMKQAENLNAVSHINYQIRQSWKLLTWRYRMVGSAGEWHAHPFQKSPPMSIPRGGDDDTLGNIHSDFFDAPAFCAAYVPFKPMPEAENTCRDMATKGVIKLFPAPKIIAPFVPLTAALHAAGLQALANIKRRCQISGTYNFILLGSFVVAYNIDQGDRSLLMTQIARSMSADKNDFWDIDGDSVKTGVEKTLKNNLTSANRDGLSEFKMYNSLADEKCNSSNRGKDQPPKWLTPIRVYPGFAYMDTYCKADKIEPEMRTLPEDPINLKDSPPEVQTLIKGLQDFIGIRNPWESAYNFSVGVEKNPWCMPYVGVSAKSKPNIPFSIGGVTLTAKSFAKPFGGRVGPWYGKTWTPDTYASNGKKIDDQLPPRVTDANNIGDPNDLRRVPNYSRFVGDLYGLKTRNVHYQYGKAIYELDPRWKSGGYNAVKGGVVENFADSAPNFEHWTSHLPFKFTDKSANGNGDLLAWDSKNDGPSRMRDLELLAVLPDTFDITYYSIEPDYYNNYFKRLRDGFLTKVGKDFNKMIRPDVGYHKGYNKSNVNLENFSIKDQYKVLKERTVEEIDIENKITYVTKQWDHALTGWAGKDLLDFSLDTARFGRCSYPTATTGQSLTVPTSGNCVQGGSVGYSVKAVASDYLRSSNLELGGDGAGQGALMNPPPDDF